MQICCPWHLDKGAKMIQNQKTIRMQEERIWKEKLQKKILNDVTYSFERIDPSVATP